VPQVEVTFDLDASGILKVTAKDKATSKMQHITITNSTNLSEEEVKKMQQEAEKYAAEDAEKKAKVETRNQADTMIFTAEKALKDAGDKVNADLKKEVEEKISALKSVLDSGSKEDLESKTKDLMESMQKIGSAMYEPQAQEPKAQETEEKKPEEGEVVTS